MAHWKIRGNNKNLWNDENMFIFPPNITALKHLLVSCCTEIVYIIKFNPTHSYTLSISTQSSLNLNCCLHYSFDMEPWTHKFTWTDVSQVKIFMFILVHLVWSLSRLRYFSIHKCKWLPKLSAEVVAKFMNFGLKETLLQDPSYPYPLFIQRTLCGESTSQTCRYKRD